VKQRGVYVTTTLASTMGQNLVMFDLDQLNDPLLALTVPPEQLATARDLEAWKETMFTMFRVCFPDWVPSFLIRLLLKVTNLKRELSSQLESASSAIMAMHRSGIPIVAGTDSANWPPLFLNFFHGPSTVLKLELLVKAVMAPLDVISSATRIPAEMMRKSADIGTVEVGKRADLIVVQEDPLKDIRALRKLSWSIKDGEARAHRKSGWRRSYLSLFSIMVAISFSNWSRSSSER
jgi:hypothetical protein